MTRARSSRASSRSRRRKGSYGPLLANLLKSLLFISLGLLAAFVLFQLRDPLGLLAAAVRDWFITRFGVGIIIPVVSVGVLALILGRHGERVLIRRWRRTAGFVLFAVAAIAAFGLMRPDVTIGGVSLAQTTAGGDIGAILGGDGLLGGLLRLSVLVLAGAALIWPSRTARAGRSGADQVKRAAARLPGAAANLKRSLDRPMFNSPVSPAPSPTPAPWAQDPAAPPIDTDSIILPGIEVDLEPIVSEPPLQSESELEPEIPDPDAAVARSLEDGVWELPPPDLLERSEEVAFSAADNDRRARLLEETLRQFDVSAKVVQVNQGPAVTQFGIEPGWDIKYKDVRERDAGGKIKLDRAGNPVIRREEVSRTRVKVNRITALANDLALALAAQSIRIEAPVPGRAMIGIEVPNSSTTVVTLRSVIESRQFTKLSARTKLALAMGKSVEGDAIVADLSKMPHLLIAGATGSGKSVCINSIIACLMMHADPTEVRFLMVDPKRVELAAFATIPHLLAPIVTESDKVLGALRWITRKMDQRYTRFAESATRNIDAYNRNPPDGRKLPFIVVVIDELADVIMTAPFEVERTLCRLAQLARASGIHLIIATQRPSVDVVTGLIKANFPTRIAFAVTSQVDSRTILDGGGAEKLLGRGDMLFLPTDAAKPKRLQGVYLSDEEIERVVAFWNDHRPASDDLGSYGSEIEEMARDEDTTSPPGDALYDEARIIAEDQGSLSTSYLQRRLRIGYNRAARLVEQLETDGVIGLSEDGRRREFLPPSSDVDD